MCSNGSMPTVDGMFEHDKRDRCCTASGCTTKLSTYNTSDLCFAHADEQSRARFDWRPSNTTSAIYRQRNRSQTHP